MWGLSAAAPGSKERPLCCLWHLSSPAANGHAMPPVQSGCHSQLLNATVPHGGCGLVWQAASALETGRPPETVAAGGFSTGEVP